MRKENIPELEIIDLDHENIDGSSLKADSRKPNGRPGGAKISAAGSARARSGAIPKSKTDADGIGDAAAESKSNIQDADNNSDTQEKNISDAEKKDDIDTEDFDTEGGDVVEDFDTEDGDVAEDFDTEGGDIAEDFDTESGDVVEDFDTEGGDVAEDFDTEGGDDTEDFDAESGDAGHTPRKKFPINIHVVLLVVVVVTVSFILYKYLTWGQQVDPDEAAAGTDDYIAESYDSILSLTDGEGNIIAPNLEDGLSIAIFGNGPFAEDRDSEDGLAAMLAKSAGATVYNCSISGSYLASTEVMPDMSINPWDGFNFYWMSLLSTDLEVYDFPGQAIEALGTDAPPEAAAVRETMSTLDFDTVDVIVIMYDASDYLAGHPANTTEEISPTQSFAGNLEAGLQILRQEHPNTRIIVMSPTYAFSDRLDENGNYISSDIVRYGQDTLSAYIRSGAQSCGAAQVSYVDNFYVTFNEDNAVNYLSDNIHLNAEGRKKVIERLLYALNYYNEL